MISRLFSDVHWYVRVLIVCIHTRCFLFHRSEQLIRFVIHRRSKKVKIGFFSVKRNLNLIYDEMNIKQKFVKSTFHHRDYTTRSSEMTLMLMTTTAAAATMTIANSSRDYALVCADGSITRPSSCVRSRHTDMAKRTGTHSQSYAQARCNKFQSPGKLLYCSTFLHSLADWLDGWLAGQRMLLLLLLLLLSLSLSLLLGSLFQQTLILCVYGRSCVRLSSTTTGSQSAWLRARQADCLPARLMLSNLCVLLLMLLLLATPISSNGKIFNTIFPFSFSGKMRQSAPFFTEVLISCDSSRLVA